MIEAIKPIDFVQKLVADKLRNEPWFDAHNVKIIEQNSQELQFLLRTRLEEIKNVSLIVGVDSIRNNHTGLEVTITVTCTERVVSNRSKQVFATAIDAACAAIHVLDCSDEGGTEQVWHFDEMHHDSIRETDMLRATATFGGIVDRMYFNRNEGE